MVYPEIRGPGFSRLNGHLIRSLHNTYNISKSSVWGLQCLAAVNTWT